MTPERDFRRPTPSKLSSPSKLSPHVLRAASSEAALGTYNLSSDVKRHNLSPPEAAGEIAWA